MTDPTAPRPDFTSPIAGRIEVRDPCPWCSDRPMVPRSLMDEHVAQMHPEVQTVEPPVSRAVLRERYATAIHDAMEPDLSLVDQEPAYQALIARAAEAAMLLADADRAAAPGCICGHPEERHFEDVCQTCGCGDYLEPRDAAEVIARWRQAALKARIELRRMADEAQPDDTVHACPGRWGGPDCRCFDDDERPGTEAVSRATLVELVRDFLDPDPCSFDHHGYCQAHAAGFGGEPMSCPHGRARKLLATAAAEAQQDGARS